MACFAWAAQRSAEEAREVARMFFTQNVSTRSAGDISLVAVSGDLLGTAETRGTETETAFYVFNRGDEAFVIVSGDDRMKSVLAYSDQGAFITENLPANLLSWLNLCQQTYLELDGQPSQTWESMPLTRATATTRSYPSSVAPLMNINWDQSAPYNNMCPRVTNASGVKERAVTGCVATAMAMVMKYYNYPTQGQGEHTITVDETEYSLNFAETTFDWDNMLPEYVAGEYNDAQANAVAQLMWACGVAVDMQYGSSDQGGSGAYSTDVAQALIDYFGYNENMGYVFRDYFDSSEWLEMIKEELSNQRPVIYNGSSLDAGHEFVLDGYDEQNLVHVNWGWSGSNNGYFEVYSLNPVSKGTGGGSDAAGGFSRNQGMVIGMHPSSDATSYRSYFLTNKVDTKATTVQKGATWKFFITGLYNMSSTFKGGDLSLIFEKDGVLKERISLGDLGEAKTYYGWTFNDSIEVTMPTTLTDGVYLVYPAIKDNRETTWNKVRAEAGYQTGFTVTVSGTTCTLQAYKGAFDIGTLQLSEVTSLHALYGGYKGSFTMSVQNTGEVEFYGQVCVLFKTKEGETSKAYVGATPTLLLGGTEQDYELSGTLLSNLVNGSTSVSLSAGEYYLLPAIIYGGYIYSVSVNEETPVVTVKEAAVGVAKLQIKDFRVAKEVIAPDEQVTLEAKMWLTGRGSVYNETLIAAVFASGENSTTNIHTQEVFIEREDTLNFSMSFYPRVGEGDYMVCLYKINELTNEFEYNNPAERASFTVSSTTGIEAEPVAESKSLKVYGQPVGDMLRFTAPEEVSKLTIYNLAGQAVLQQQLGAAWGGDYSVAVSGLAGGTYIAVMQTADGKSYRTKFMKK